VSVQCTGSWVKHFYNVFKTINIFRHFVPIWLRCMQILHVPKVYLRAVQWEPTFCCVKTPQKNKSRKYRWTVQIQTIQEVGLYETLETTVQHTNKNSSVNKKFKKKNRNHREWRQAGHRVTYRTPTICTRTSGTRIAFFPTRSARRTSGV